MKYWVWISLLISGAAFGGTGEVDQPLPGYPKTYGVSVAVKDDQAVRRTAIHEGCPHCEPGNSHSCHPCDPLVFWQTDLYWQAPTAALAQRGDFRVFHSGVDWTPRLIDAFKSHQWTLPGKLVVEVTEVVDPDQAGHAGASRRIVRQVLKLTFEDLPGLELKSVSELELP
jgi:hypothetical protein